MNAKKSGRTRLPLPTGRNLLSWKAMEPAEKRPPTPPPATAVRKLRFDAAHPRVPRPLHLAGGKDRPGGR
jgi:hypothetical protein